MTFQPNRRSLGVAGIAIALAVAAPTAVADDVRPVQVAVRELPSGAFDVQWSVPKVMPPQAMPGPRLPAQCRPEGPRTFIDNPTAWLTRQVYRCPDGLAGQALGISFPFPNTGLSTLLRVEFVSGERYAHMLNPGEDSWQIPEAAAGGFPQFLREAQRAALSGVNLFLNDWVYLAFVVALCLLGGVRVTVRLLTVFLVAQVAGVVFGSFSGVQLAAPLAQIGVALAAVLLATEVLRPPDGRNQLGAIAIVAGVVHGLGLHSLVSAAGADGPSVLYLFLAAVGLDAALLVSALLVSAIGRFASRRLAHQRYAKVAAYGTAGVAFALALSAMVDGPTTPAKNSERQLELPRMMAASGGAALPGSRRVASNTPDAAIQSFLAVEAFDVRHEVLVRLADVTELIDIISPGREISIENQSAVKERIGELVATRASLTIDGEIREPVTQRIDFITLDDKGVLPRATPVPEPIETAWIGVSAMYLTAATAQDVSLTWGFGEVVTEIPTTVTDPELSRSTVLTPNQPMLRWDNVLVEDPVPTVSTIAVEPTWLTVPLWSLAPLAASLFFAIGVLRRRRPALSLALSRVMLVVAVLLGPLGNLTIAVPWSAGSAPSASQAQRILAGVLPNIYRALEFREESVAFDRLALSMTGETLTDVYLDHRRVLAMEERGGAQARVEAVEVIEVESVESEDSGGFSADAVWTVGGTVTHFGHRHFRQNRYDARVAVVADEGIWKVRRIEVLNEERVR